MLLTVSKILFLFSQGWYAIGQHHNVFEITYGQRSGGKQNRVLVQKIDKHPESKPFSQAYDYDTAILTLNEKVRPRLGGL